MKVRYLKLGQPEVYAVIYHRDGTIFYNLDFTGGKQIYVFK